MSTQIETATPQQIQLWKSRVDALAVIDDGSHSTIITIGTLATKAIAQLTVTDQASYDEAALLGVVLASVEKKVKKEYWDPKTALADQQHKQLCRARDEEIGPIIAGKKAAGMMTATFEREQERLRRDEQERLRLEAEKLQREEAQRIADELQRKADAEALIEAERVRAEQIAAGATKREANQAAREIAKQVASQGEADAAQVISEQMSRPVVAPAVQSTFTKAKGTSVRQPWGAEIIDEKKAVEWILADWPNRRHFLKLIQSEFDSVAKKTEGKAVIPGVRFVQKEATSQFRR